VVCSIHLVDLVGLLVVPEDLEDMVGLSVVPVDLVVDLMLLADGILEVQGVHSNLLVDY